ncbi:unnamed protein product [Cochlearia groenlandica]
MFDITKLTICWIVKDCKFPLPLCGGSLSSMTLTMGAELSPTSRSAFSTTTCFVFSTAVGFYSPATGSVFSMVAGLLTSNKSTRRIDVIAIRTADRRCILEKEKAM